MKNQAFFLPKMNNIAVVATFLFLWIAVYFNDDVENMLAYFLILTFGMLHGANDLKLIRKSTQNTTGRHVFFRILSLYVLVVLSGFALFYLLPGLAFVLFIVVSGYHFGEQHWFPKLYTKSLLGRCLALLYGLFILSMLFAAHPETVSAVIEKITGYYVAEVIYSWSLWACGGLTVLLYLILHFQKQIKAHIVKQLFFLLVFFIVFHTASLLWSFAIYFVLWHSLPSIADQIVYLYGNLTKQTFLQYVRSSFIYWLVAVLGSIAILFVLRNDMETALSFFISFLAAITFPHVLVISRLEHY
ncbi:Brp/Blh family beta-carotene 15,15'-dioxygenase [Ascidiimonas aurantiaca]|uniref:Brp/Blh family beta-carotene 15,15'-dioxygenase n=1 Tax=Ascidiimonas aurantiaca TaxID=1685432 RepID=UPI0030EE82DB